MKEMTPEELDKSLHFAAPTMFQMLMDLRTYLIHEIEVARLGSINDEPAKEWVRRLNRIYWIVTGDDPPTT